MNLYAKMNNNTQRILDKSFNVYSKTREKKFEPYFELTNNLGKNVFHQPVFPE